MAEHHGCCYLAIILVIIIVLIFIFSYLHYLDMKSADNILIHRNRSMLYSGSGLKYPFYPIWYKPLYSGLAKEPELGPDYVDQQRALD